MLDATMVIFFNEALSLVRIFPSAGYETIEIASPPPVRLSPFSFTSCRRRLGGRPRSGFLPLQIRVVHPSRLPNRIRRFFYCRLSFVDQEPKGVGT